MNNDFYNSISSIDNKNEKLKALFNLPGFNYENKPIKITDNLNINNHFIYNNKVIDEKIFVNFYGAINNSENAKSDKNNKNKKTKKNKKNKESKKTRKIKNQKKQEKYFVIT